MIDLTKPVQTRAGRKARIVASDVADARYPVLALITGADGDEFPAIYTIEGKAYFDQTKDRHEDLVQARYVPKGYEGKRTLHLNLGHSYGSVHYAGAPFPAFPVLTLEMLDGEIVSHTLTDALAADRQPSAPTAGRTDRV